MGREPQVVFLLERNRPVLFLGWGSAGLLRATCGSRTTRMVSFWKGIDSSVWIGWRVVGEVGSQAIGRVSFLIIE